MLFSQKMTGRKQKAGCKANFKVDEKNKIIHSYR